MRESSLVVNKLIKLDRIAVAFGSPRIANGYDEFYQQLRDCETLETASIHATLSLNIPGSGQLITAEKTGGLGPYIDESSACLRVFVPRNKSERETCFQTKFPRHFLEWMMSDVNTNIVRSDSADIGRIPGPEIFNIMQAVLNAESCGLQGIMDENGVPELDSRYNDDFEEDEDESREDEHEVVEGTHASIPNELVRLDPPPKGQIKIGGESNVRAKARWKFAPSSKDKGDWLQFDKGDTITNINCEFPVL